MVQLLQSHSSIFFVVFRELDTDTFTLLAATTMVTLLLTHKVLFLPHMSSNINMASEIWT